MQKRLAGFEYAIKAMNRARADISGVKVGVALLASNGEHENMLFTGCNIEVSIGCQANIHAERLALLKAVSEGYTKPEICIITSNTNTHKAAMCGYCMQDYTYFNPECRIIVIDEQSTEVLIDTTVRKRQGKYGYFSKGTIKKS